MTAAYPAVESMHSRVYTPNEEEGGGEVVASGETHRVREAELELRELEGGIFYAKLDSSYKVGDEIVVRADENPLGKSYLVSDMRNKDGETLLYPSTMKTDVDAIVAAKTLRMHQRHAFMRLKLRTGATKPKRDDEKERQKRKVAKAARRKNRR